LDQTTYPISGLFIVFHFDKQQFVGSIGKRTTQSWKQSTNAKIQTSHQQQ
jgi:hypothetical protein